MSAGLRLLMRISVLIGCLSSAANAWSDTDFQTTLKNESDVAQTRFCTPRGQQPFTRIERTPYVVSPLNARLVGTTRSSGAVAKIGIWGDSHTASGVFSESMLETLGLPLAHTYPSYIAPTFGLKGVKPPLNQACLGGNWQLEPAFRSSDKAQKKFTPSLVTLSSNKVGAFLGMDFRYPSLQTRVKNVDLFFNADFSNGNPVLGVTVDDNSEVEIPLTADAGGVLKISSPQPFSTLEIRLISGAFHIDGFAPMYIQNPQVILDVLSIPGSTGKGWWFVDTHRIQKAQKSGSNYDTVMLQFGTNESLDPVFQSAHYEAELSNSIIQLKKAYPRARCILIGPPDAKRTAATLQLINKSQQRVAKAYQCSHWDWQKFMGGAGASQYWLTQDWMRPDLIHMTTEGYRKSSRAMALWWLSQSH